jgi:hypothetical protein
MERVIARGGFHSRSRAPAQGGRRFPSPISCCWIENRWILVKDGRQKEHRFGHRIYAATELVSLLEGVGFSTMRSFGDLGGSPYDQRAQRLVVVAQK